MLNCREVTRLIASEEITRAGLFTRIALRIHLLLCSRCRRYARQVGMMGSVARQLWGKGEEDPAELENLKAKILAASKPPDDTSDQQDYRQSDKDLE